jgi:chromosome segregation ATPase
MARDLGRRYGSADRLADDLERYLADRWLSVDGLSTLLDFAPVALRRHRAWALLAAALVVAAAVLSTQRARALSREAEQARQHRAELATQDARHEAALREEASAIEALQAQRAALEAERSSLDAQVATLAAQRDELVSARARVEASRDAFARTAVNAEAARARTEVDRDRREADRAAAERAHERDAVAVVTIEKELEEAEGRAWKLKSALESTSAALEARTADLAACQRALKTGRAGTAGAAGPVAPAGSGP